MAQVFGCPQCQQKFQVPDDAAGMSFQCPACKFAVEIPVENQVVEPTAETDQLPQIFGCPHCHGQFGITQNMIGNELECPHCEETVAVSAETVPDFEETDVDETDAAKDEDDAKAAFLKRPRLKSHTGKVAEKPKMESADNSNPAPQKWRTDETVPDAHVDSVPETVSEFKPSSVDHLLPPKFDVLDPARFPSSLKSGRVLLPDGSGGFQSADANTVTITHNGQVYHLKRLDPQQRQRRQMIHSTIAIAIAVLLIYLTLKTLGVSLF
jgi:DNA-directed RNA polymerase subunit RPC12/RpoP